MLARDLSETGKRWRWLLQCCFMFIIMTTFLFIANEDLARNAVVSVVGATSLGATAFLAFVAHNSYMAQARRIILGYLTAAIIGILFYHCAELVNQLGLPITAHHVVLFCAAGSAAIAMLCMTILHVEHPPAAGLALGIVIRYWDMHLLVVVMIFVLLIAVIKFWLRDWLITLQH